MTYDLRDASFEAFLDFLFDHPVAAQHREANWGKEPGKDIPHESAWYDDLGRYPWAQVSHDPDLTAGFYIRLFEGPRILSDRYSRGQIAQGFEIIPGLPILDFPLGLGRLFVEELVPLEERLSVARSLGSLHHKLLQPHGFHDAVMGFWLRLHLVFDSAVELSATDRNSDAGIQALQQALFEVLVDLIEHSDPEIAGTAIYALGQSDHPDTAAAVRACLASRHDLGANTVELAQRVIAFFESGTSSS